jgi:TetR/AcrR family transcriptional regulator, cholesterol catabolism regulator
MGKKEVILKSAASLFRSKGFAAASMRNLADAVGVEAPSLYNHIGSKSQLLQEICFSVATDFTVHMHETAAMQCSAVQKIERILRFHTAIMLRRFDEVFVANHEWKHLPEPMLGNFLNQRHQYEKRFAGLVEDGIAAGELKPLHPYTVTLTFLSALRGLEFWQRNKKNVGARELEDDMTALLLNGIIQIKQ